MRIIACLFVVFALAACKGTDPATQPSGQAEIVNTMCPIMPTHPIDAEGDTAMVGDHKVGFCCSGCVDKFNEWPESKKTQFVEDMMKK